MKYRPPPDVRAIRRSLIRLLTEAEKETLARRGDPLTVESIADFIHEDALRVLRGAKPMNQPAPKLETELLGLLLRHTDHLLPYWSARGESHIITHEGVRQVLSIAVEILESGHGFSIAALFNELLARGMNAAQAGVARLINEADTHAADAERAYVELVESLGNIARAKDLDRRRAEMVRLPLDEQLAILRREAESKRTP